MYIVQTYLYFLRYSCLTFFYVVYDLSRKSKANRSYLLQKLRLLTTHFGQCALIDYRYRVIAVWLNWNIFNGSGSHYSALLSSSAEECSSSLFLISSNLQHTVLASYLLYWITDYRSLSYQHVYTVVRISRVFCFQIENKDRLSINQNKNWQTELETQLKAHIEQFSRNQE